MPKDCKNDTNTNCGCNSNGHGHGHGHGKKVTPCAIDNIEYSKKYTSLDETILLHDTVIDGKLEVDGKVKVDGKLDVDGKISLEGKLDVSGLSELNDVLINGKLTVNEDTLLHDTTIDGSLNAVNLYVSGTATVNNLNIDGSLNIINIAELNHVKINRSLLCSALTVSGISKLHNVTVDGSLNVFHLDVSGNAVFNNNVTVDGSLNVAHLDVSGDAVFNNNVTIDGSLNVVNLAELNSLKVKVLTECYDLNVLGSTQLDHARIINGVTVDGSLNVAHLDVSGDAVFNNNVTVDGSLNVVNLAVSGDANIANLTVNDNLNVFTSITFSDNTLQTTAYNIPESRIFGKKITFTNSNQVIHDILHPLTTIDTYVIKIKILKIYNNENPRYITSYNATMIIITDLIPSNSNTITISNINESYLSNSIILKIDERDSTLEGISISVNSSVVKINFININNDEINYILICECISIK